MEQITQEVFEEIDTLVTEMDKVSTKGEYAKQLQSKAAEIWD